MGMFRSKENGTGQARTMPPRDGSTLMAGCTLEGKFQFKGVVIIAANIRGELDCDGTIFVEPAAKIEGTLTAPEIIVQGKVTGNLVSSRSIEVWRGAVIEGDIYTPSLRVDEGARLDASLTVALERPVAHINRSSVPAMENVTPLVPSKAEAAPTPEPAKMAATPAPRTMFTKAS
jgi:cytoskeletal protein CcmA (bactofilin family)